MYTVYETLDIYISCYYCNMKVYINMIAIFHIGLYWHCAAGIRSAASLLSGLS